MKVTVQHKAQDVEQVHAQLKLFMTKGQLCHKVTTEGSRYMKITATVGIWQSFP